jgi:hypothetical protein
LVHRFGPGVGIGGAQEIQRKRRKPTKTDEDQLGQAWAARAPRKIKQNLRNQTKPMKTH